MYELIVLGATFAAAGIAKVHQEKCLIIEPGMEAGYEFTQALRPGLQEDFLYRSFCKSNVLFATQIVSVEKEEDGFVCVTHGVDGFRTHRAKTVIDTRVCLQMCQSKTYNLLIESPAAPENLGVGYTQAAETRYVIFCPVELDCDYPQARAKVYEILGKFTEGQRLILSANEFDYVVKDGYPKWEDGILQMPSKAYETAAKALKAGEEWK